MKLIYNNFDAFDVSFQGALPESVLIQLAEAKERAQFEKSEVLAEIGETKMKVMVAETGMSGGYRYRFKTAEIDGEIWSIAHSTNSKNWNIRVSCSSAGLALKGMEAVRSGIIKRLIALNAIGPSRHNSAKINNLSATDSTISPKHSVINTPLERVSRFDYCFDFIMNSAFVVLPERFIAHQRAKKHIYSEKGYIDNYTSMNGDKVNTIRIGKMPNREATLYNKGKEISANSKQYWWHIWGLDPKIIKKDSKTIWRIEVRAGKEELNKWGLNTFEDFDRKAGDVIAHILKSIRYTEPLIGDPNRSRWPMHAIWDQAYQCSNRVLEPYRSNAMRENIIRDYRENIIKGYKERLIGNLIGLTAANGLDISEIFTVIEQIQKEMNIIVRMDMRWLENKISKKCEQSRFIE